MLALNTSSTPLDEARQTARDLGLRGQSDGTTHVLFEVHRTDPVRLWWALIAPPAIILILLALWGWLLSDPTGTNLMVVAIPLAALGVPLWGYAVFPVSRYLKGPSLANAHKRQIHFPWYLLIVLGLNLGKDFIPDGVLQMILWATIVLCIVMTAFGTYRLVQAQRAAAAVWHPAGQDGV